MKVKKILGISIPIESKQDILEEIKKYISHSMGFCHIVSLNPENLVITQKDKDFKKVVETAQIRILDGIGLVLAARIIGAWPGERYPGVDLMTDLIKEADKMRLRVMLIGGKPNLAVRLVQCYRDKMLQAKFVGLSGIKDIKNPKKAEEEQILTIVADYRPHLVFVAFGSPDQEKWIDRHHRQFNNCVVMGVGGAFDFLSGEIKRAPVIFRKLGLEWIFRLSQQPWRLKRQLKLLIFIFLIIKQKLGRLDS